MSYYCLHRQNTRKYDIICEIFIRILQFHTVNQTNENGIKKQTNFAFRKNAGVLVLTQYHTHFHF